MSDTTGHNRDGSPQEPADSPDRPAVSLSPRQRRMYLKGLRAWARVAVRSYANRHGPQHECPDKPDDGGQTAKQTAR